MMRTMRAVSAGKRAGDLDAVLATLRSELSRVKGDSEREALKALLDRADAPGATEEFRRYVAGYVRAQFEVLFGPDQFLMPLFGVLAAVIVPLGLFGIFSLIWSGNEPLGIRWPVFATVVVAGMAGGVVRVLWLSAQKQHEANSVMQLFFTGLLHPLIGGALGVALAAAFASGLVAFPVADPGARAIGGEWTQAELFLAFTGFVAGVFEERVIRMLGSLVPSRGSGSQPADNARGPAGAESGRTDAGRK
jgi:hypothetical protein